MRGLQSRLSTNKMPASVLFLHETYRKPQALAILIPMNGGYWPQKTDTSSIRHMKMQYLRGHALTLHQSQSLSRDLISGFMVWSPDENKEGREIRSSANAQLRFHTSQSAYDFNMWILKVLIWKKYVTLSMIWTAWDPRGFTGDDFVECKRSKDVMK